MYIVLLCNSVRCVIGKPLSSSIYSYSAGFCKGLRENCGVGRPFNALRDFNVDAARFLAQRYAILSTPTLVLFNQGIERQRISGVMSMPGLRGLARSDA